MAAKYASRSWLYLQAGPYEHSPLQKALHRNAPVEERACLRSSLARLRDVFSSGPGASAAAGRSSGARGGGGGRRYSRFTAQSPRARSSSVVGGSRGSRRGSPERARGRPRRGASRAGPRRRPESRARGERPRGWGRGDAGVRAPLEVARPRVRRGARGVRARLERRVARGAREQSDPATGKTSARVVVGGSREYQSGAQAQRRALGANSSSFSDASRPSRATWRDPVASSETTTRLGTRFRARSHAHDARRRLPRPPRASSRGSRTPRPRAPPPAAPPLRARCRSAPASAPPAAVSDRTRRLLASVAGSESGAGGAGGARPSPRSSARTRSGAPSATCASAPPPPPPPPPS